MMNPLDGRVVWPVPDNHSISVTLFKDPRTHEMEDKDWTFVLEDVSNDGWNHVFLSCCFFMLPSRRCSPRNAQCFSLYRYIYIYLDDLSLLSFVGIHVFTVGLCLVLKTTKLLLANIQK